MIVVLSYIEVARITDRRKKGLIGNCSCYFQSLPWRALSTKRNYPFVTSPEPEDMRMFLPPHRCMERILRRTARIVNRPVRMWWGIEERHPGVLIPSIHPISLARLRIPAIYLIPRVIYVVTIWVPHFSSL
jgi:hypothetical protein